MANEQNLKHFKPGQSGNPKGRPPGRSLRQLVRETADVDKLAIVEKAIALAKAGNMSAMAWFARLDVDKTDELTTTEFTIRISHPQEDDGDADSETRHVTPSIGEGVPDEGLDDASEDVSVPTPEPTTPAPDTLPETPRRRRTPEERFWSEG